MFCPFSSVSPQGGRLPDQIIQPRLDICQTRQKTPRDADRQKQPVNLWDILHPDTNVLFDVIDMIRTVLADGKTAKPMTSIPGIPTRIPFKRGVESEAACLSRASIREVDLFGARSNSHIDGGLQHSNRMVVPLRQTFRPGIRTHNRKTLEQFTKRCGRAGSWKCHFQQCFLVRRGHKSA